MQRTAFFDLSIDLLGTVDLKGILRDVNSAWTETFGWSRDELLEKPFSDFIHPDDLERSLDEMTAIRNGKNSVLRFENRWLLKSTGHKWIAWSARVDPSTNLVYVVGRDITQTKLNELFFEEMQNAAKIGSWRMNATDKTTAWSAETYRILEIPLGTPQENILDISYPPKSRTLLDEGIRACIEEQKSFDIEIEIRTGKENLIWLRLIGHPIVAEGKVIELYGVMQDITKQKHIELEMEKTNERLRFILEGANVASWEWIIDTNRFNFDDRWCQMIGLDSKNTLRLFKTWEERIHADDLAQTLSELKKHIDGRTEYFESTYRIRHADGRWIWVLDRGKVTKHDEKGKAQRLSVTHFDVTDRKEAEQRLRHALTASQMGTWDLDLVANRLIWDRSMYDLYGNSPSDFDDTFEAWEKTIHPEDIDRVNREFQDAIKTGHPFDSQFRIIRPNTGEVRVFSAKGRVEYDDQAQPLRVTGLTWDITTEYVQAQLIKEQQAKIVTTAKMSSLGEMAGGIAHEINNPLSIIQGKANQLRRRIANGQFDQEKFGAELQKIEETSQRIFRIIKGLRSFSRNAEEDPFTRVPLKSIIEETLELCQERFKNNLVTVSAQFNDEVEIECRPTQLSQVVLNLLNNAFDAIHGKPTAWIRVETHRLGDFARILITDSGDGIAPEVAEKMMQPFYTTKEIGKGTGLGLSISRGIIEAHHGQIWLDRKSQNTTFVIDLPTYQDLMKNSHHP